MRDVFKNLHGLMVREWLLGLGLTWPEKILLAYIQYRTSRGDGCALEYQDVARILQSSRSTAAAVLKRLIADDYLVSRRIGGRKEYFLGDQSVQLLKGVQISDESKTQTSGVQNSDADRVRKSDSSTNRYSMHKNDSFKQKEERPLFFEKFDDTIKNALDALVDGPWRQKDSISIEKNIEFLTHYEPRVQREIINYTLRGEYPCFYSPSNEILEAARCAQGQRSPLKGDVTDSSFTYRQNSDKNPTPFRTSVRAAWAMLAGICTSDEQRDAVYGDATAFSYADKTLSITAANILQPIATQDRLAEIYTKINGISNIRISYITC